MYTVIAHNFLDTIAFEETYLSAELASAAFNTARQCVDCSLVFVMNALTGEIIIDWSADTDNVHIY